MGVIGFWTLKQFGIAIQDVAAIPGILGGLPGDVFHLHLTSAFQDIGNAIDDAGRRVVLGVEGVILTYVVAKLVKPFDAIYRKDQLIPGARLVTRCLDWILRKADK